MQLAEADGFGVGPPFVGDAGGLVAVPWPDDAGDPAGRVLAGASGTPVALGVPVAEAVADAPADGRCRWVSPGAGAVVSGPPVAGPVPLVPGFSSEVVAAPALGDEGMASTSAPRPPIASTPATVSSSTILRDLRFRSRDRADCRPPPASGPESPGSATARGASTGRSAVAAGTSASAGRPHPGQDRAPLRWRLQVEQ